MTNKLKIKVNFAIAICALFVATTVLNSLNSHVFGQQQYTFQQMQQADQLAGQAAQLHQSGRLAEAAASLKTAVGIFEQVLGTRHEKTLYHYQIAGILLSDAKSFQESTKYLQQAHDGWVQLGKTGDSHFIKTLQYLAAGYMSLGDTKKAEAYGQKLIDATKQKHGLNHPETAMAFHALSRIAMTQGKFDAAKQHSRQSLEIMETALGPDHEATLAANNNLAYVCFNSGSRTNDLAEAKGLYLKSLDILKRTKPELDKTKLDVLPYLATIFNRSGDFESAKNYLQQAIKISAANNSDTSFFRRLLADAKYESGDKENAIVDYQELILSMKQNPGAQHPDTATLINELGEKLFWAGDYGGARKHLGEALEIRKKIYGMSHLETAESLFIWGGLLGRQGDLEEAVNAQLQALEIRQKLLPKDHPKIASSLEAVGGVYQSLRQYEKATPYFERSLKIFKSHYGPEHPRTAETEKNYGVHLANQGDFNKAVPYLERSVTLREKLFGDQAWETAASLEDLAWVYNESGQGEKSRELYQRAYEIREQIQGEASPFAIKTLLSVALIDYRQDKVNDAIEKFDQYIRRSNEHVVSVLPSLNEQEQLRYLAISHRDPLQNLVSFIGYDPTDSDLVTKALSWVINGKSIRLNSLANRQQISALRQSDANFRSLFDRLSVVRQQLSTLTLSNANQDGQDLKSLRKTEAELARQLQVIVDEKLPKVDSWVEVDDVRKSVPKDGALIEIVRNWAYDFEGGKNIGAHYFAWVVPQSGKRDIKFIDLGDADQIDEEIDKSLELLRSSFEKGDLSDKGESETTNQLNDQLTSISNLVWNPIRNELDDSISQLIISPDGPLWLLPWSAIPTKDGRYLIEDFALHFELSGRELARQRVGKKDNKRSFIFADPDYDLSAESTRQAIRKLFPKRKLDASANQPGPRTALNSVSRLPNTKAEADAVAPSIEKMLGKAPQPYTGKWALETVLKGVRNPKYLLLSTHGFFLPNQQATKPKGFAELARSNNTRGNFLQGLQSKIENPLLRCGLLLAGCNSGKSVAGDDGVFTGLEVSSLDLSGTELVVLSACETAVGDVNSGEGVAGLRQAFQSAGAESVVATLWQVPDRDSAIIMTDFFKNLADGQSRTEALRNAQLQRIAARRERNGAAHPFFWAAWTLTGFSKTTMNLDADLTAKSSSKNTADGDVDTPPTESEVILREAAMLPEVIALNRGQVPKDNDKTIAFLCMTNYSARSTYLLARLYEIGEVVHQSDSKAASLYARAGYRGDPSGPSRLIELYRRGESTSTYTVSHAIKYAEELVKKKTIDESVLVELVKIKFTQELEKASQGDRYAQLEVGYKYHFGRGVEIDYEEAMKWYRKAADQGLVRAKYRIGVMYEYGRSVLKDEAEAFKWFQLAAREKDMPAINSIGDAYRYGQGVEKDYVQAAQWYRKGVALDHNDCINDLAYLHSTGKGVKQDDAKSLDLYLKTASKGNAVGQYNVAYQYAHGLGTKTNNEEAARWYIKAAKQGHKQAQYFLGRLYESGTGVERDAVEAAKWSRLSAEQGYPPAQYSLGRAYLLGLGLPQNLPEAINWMEKSGENGFSQAHYVLGLTYENGNGVPIDIAKAKYWFEKASDQGYQKAKTALKKLELRK